MNTNDGYDHYSPFFSMCLICSGDHDRAVERFDIVIRLGRGQEERALRAVAHDLVHRDGGNDALAVLAGDEVRTSLCIVLVTIY